jgi:hypothetical protein
MDVMYVMYGVMVDGGFFGGGEKISLASRLRWGEAMISASC